MTFIETNRRIVVASELGIEENGELLFDSYRDSIWDDEEALEMDAGNSHTTMY